MSFAADIQRFQVKVEAKLPAVFANIASALHESIVEGSPLTGSPGQPVGQYGPGYHPHEVGGDLKNSWQLEFTSPTEALISSNSDHAPPNEYGVTVDGRPYMQRSTVGGRHSRALTIAGAQRIVDDEVRKANE